MKKLNLLLLLAIAGITSTANAQGLLDGFTPKKNELSVTVSYSNSTFDEFYLGTEKTDGVPAHEEISQDIISLYAKYGLSDRLSLVLSVPYISADNKSGAADPVNLENSVSGVQDISLALKYNAASFKIKGGNLDVITGVTTHIPTGYEPNGILSLGSGAFGIDITTGLHLKTDSGFFSTLLASYNFRGDADNEFTPGGDFGVPNAFQLNAKIGYASSFIYAEAWATLQNSEEGIDINSPNFAGNFPETNVDYTSVGLTLYKNIIPQIGVSLGAGTIVDGRNVGSATTFSAGLTYCFIK